MLKPQLCAAIVVLGLTAAHVMAQSSEDPADAIAVEVQQSGRTVIVDVVMPVRASPTETWQVLTDYDHMADFFPNLNSSKIVERDGNHLRVEQSGHVAYGPLSFAFQTVRDIVLTPYTEVRSQAAGGTIKEGESITKLVHQDDTTRILYHSVSVPETWVPPGIGPHLIAERTKDQFASLRREILRRQGERK